jgi:hypothetical protein
MKEKMEIKTLILELGECQPWNLEILSYKGLERVKNISIEVFPE